MRFMSSEIRSTRLSMIVGSLALAGILLSFPAQAFADGKTQEVTLFTAVAEKGDKEKFPAELVPYKKMLLNISKAFRLSGKKKNLKLTSGKEMKITLPEKLGEAKITWDGKTLTLKIEKDGKKLVSVKVSKFPLYLADDALKVKGQKVVLIIDKGKK